MNNYKNMAADITSKNIGLNSISSAVNLAAQKNELFKNANSLKSILGLQGTVSELMNSASKSIFNIPTDYGSSLSRIIESQNSIFSKVTAHKSVLSSYGSMQADLLANYAWMNTDSFLTSTIANHNWENLKDFESHSEEVEEITEKYVDGDKIDLAAFNALQATVDKLIDRVAATEDKLQRRSLYAEILNVIAIIGFLMAIYAFYQQVTDSTNDESTAEIKKTIGQSTNSITSALAQSEQRMLDSVRKITTSRVAIASLNVRFKPRKKSQKIGSIKMGDEILVLTIDHKWLYIMYTDSETGKPATGWVFKKYCEKK